MEEEQNKTGPRLKCQPNQLFFFHFKPNGCFTCKPRSGEAGWRGTGFASPVTTWIDGCKLLLSLNAPLVACPASFSKARTLSFYFKMLGQSIDSGFLISSGLVMRATRALPPRRKPQIDESRFFQLTKHLFNRSVGQQTTQTSDANSLFKAVLK